jgi:amidase
VDEIELAFAGIARQAQLIAGGEISPRELVELYLSRIERIDPKLNAYRVVLGEQALAEADRAAERRARGEELPLLGVPVAIKDDADVAGEVTAMGSAGHGPPASADSELVARLRAAGAIVIGKTNVPELMIFPFTETRRFGVTRNPWDLSRTPGGSSGGSAAAVAAGLAGAAQGSDGGGSIRIPAACCGLFGLKPQRDRISLSPQREQWHGLSVFGPLARSVRDAALFLDVTASTPAPGGSFVAAASRRPDKLRVAVSAKVPPGLIAKVAPEVRGALDGAAGLLEQLGHAVTAKNPRYGAAVSGFMRRYLRGIHDDAAAMAQPELLEPRTRGMARLGSLISPGSLARARRREASDAARINAIFDDFDVLMTPATATLPPHTGKWDGRGALWTFNGVARFVPFNAILNHLGNPAATVPIGWSDDGLPIGVQLVGRPGDEETLLSLAAQIESERPWADRRPPVAV